MGVSNLGHDISMGHKGHMGHGVNLGHDISRVKVSLWTMVSISHDISMGQSVTMGHGVNLGHDISMGQSVTMAWWQFRLISDGSMVYGGVNLAMIQYGSKCHYGPWVTLGHDISRVSVTRNTLNEPFQRHMEFTFRFLHMINDDMSNYEKKTFAEVLCLNQSDRHQS
ncbi:hypothetical protein ScPMuIL_017445 [Solemya velum]